MLKEIFQALTPRSRSQKKNSEIKIDKIPSFKKQINEIKFNKKCTITVNICSASEIVPFTDNFKEHLDIFILCKIKNHEKKTRVVNTKHEPQWEELFSFEGILLSEKENDILIEFELYDYDDVLEQNTLLGYGKKLIPISELKLDTYMSELNLESSSKLSAVLNIKVSLFSELI